MADSTTTSVVASATSELGAAHHAGDPDRAGRVGDEQRLRRRARARRGRASRAARPASRAPDDDPAVVDGRRVERVDRLAELEHHVVADASTTLLIGRCPAASRRIWTWSGDGPTVTPVDPAADEPRAQRGVLDLDPEALGRSAGAVSGDLGRRASAPVPPVTAETSRASPTIDSASPRFGLTSTSRTTSPYRSASGTPSGVSGGRIRIPSASPVRPQLVARAEHPVADDAHLLGPLDAPVAGQDGAGQRDRHALAGRDVRRAADDLERLGRRRRVTRVSDSRSARGCCSTDEQLADDDVPPVVAPALDALDLHAEQRQPLGELLRRRGRVDVLAQPGQRARVSSELLEEAQVVLEEQAQVGDAVRSIVIRSGPMPKAKPW